MKSVFARISTAIVAAAAVVASVLIVAPAASAAGTTNPALYQSNWQLQQQVSTQPSTNSSVTAVLPVKADGSFSASVNFAFGASDAASRAGHTIRVTWNATFPAGVSWNSLAGFSNSNGMGKSLNAWVSGSNVQVNDYATWQFEDSSLAATKSALSNTFVIPASLADMTQGSLELYTSINTSNMGSSSFKAPAGTYTIAPTLFDVTANQAVPLTAGSGASDVRVSDSDWAASGDESFTGASVPAGTQLRQYLVTCIEKSAVAANDVIAIRKTIDGVETAENSLYFYKKGSYQYMANGWGSYTVRASDVDSAATGFRTNATILTDNTSGSSAVGLPTFDYQIKKFAPGTTDFTTGGTVVNSSCAPVAPAQPTFTLTSRNGGTVTFPAIAGDTGQGVNTYSVKIAKASDPNTVFYRTQLYGGLMNGSYTSNLYFSDSTGANLNVETNTDYIASIAVENREDGVPSSFSTPSAATRLVPPAAPPAPTALAVTVSRATATLTIPAYVASTSYRAYLYSSADNFAVSVASGSCVGTTQTATSLSCSVNAMVSSFSAPATFKMRATAVTSSGMESEFSPFTAAVTGGVPGVVLATPSNGAGNGEAKTLTTAFPWITDTWSNGSCNPTCTVPKGAIYSDGLGKVYALNDAGVDGSTGRKFDLRRMNATSTGFDSTGFGTAGKVTTAIAGGTAMNMPNVAFFANGGKIAYFSSASSCGMNGCTYTNLLTEGTVGSAMSATVDMSQKVVDFCTANADADFLSAGPITGAYVSPFSGLQALSRPAIAVSCYNNGINSQRLVATVAADGTPTFKFKVHSVNSTQNGYSTYSTSANPSATGTQIAAVTLIVRYKKTSGSPTTYSNYERVLIRTKADGTVVETTGAYTPAAGAPEPNFTLASVNDGTTIYGLDRSGMTPALVTIPVASGNFSASQPLSVDSANMMGGTTYSFPTTGKPNVGDDIALIRSDMGMSTSYGPARLTISTKRVITGEMLSVSSSGTPLSFVFIDAAGNMNFMYTPAVSPVPTTHTVVQWKAVRAMVAQPNPTYMGKDISFSINAGGTTAKILGADLALTTAAKKVLSVTVGSKVITAITKAATSITFTIPSAALAGVVGTPTPQAPSTVPVTIQLGNGTSLQAGTMTYVGADKLVQTITNTLDQAAAFVGSPDRNLPTSVSTLIQAATPTLTPTAAPATVCTIVAGKVQFVGAGTCTVTAASAANSYLAAGVPVTKTIVVSRQNQSLAVTLDTANALVGEADRTISIVNTTSLTTAPAVVPVVTPATVCTLVAGKVHFVGAGVCTVKSSAPLSATYNASNIDTKTITVRKPDVITVTMGDIQTDDSVDGFQVPAAATSARTIVYAIDPSSSTVCSYDATMGVVKGSKTRGAGNNTCKVNLTIAQDATWGAATYQAVLTIINEPDTGTAASNPKTVANTNTPVTYKYMQYIWNRTTGSISMKLNSTWVGPNTAKITWTQGGTTYTCTSAKFGTMTKVTGAQITANKTYTSTNFCAAANAATKTALKNIAADTVVKVDITREVRYPATYAVKFAAFHVASIYLTLGN